MDDYDKIAEIYCFNNIMGCYDSFRNFCKDRIIYYSFLYGIKDMRVNSDPIKYKLSTEDSIQIVNAIYKNIKELVEIKYEEVDKYEKYILIVRSNGSKYYFKNNDNIEKILKGINKDKYTSEKSISTTSTPYLIYNDDLNSMMIGYLKELVVLLNNKNFNKIMNLISDNCELNINLDYNTTNLYSKKDIKNYFNKISGFLNSNLKNIKLYASIIGFLDKNNKSFLGLKVEITDKQYNKNNLMVYVSCNNNYINNITILNYNDDNTNKVIYKNEDFDLIKQKNYNDFK